jgi:hypothetical protein
MTEQQSRPQFIAQGDMILAAARRLAHDKALTPTGRLPSGVAAEFYVSELLDAAFCYRVAGLRFLSLRVYYFARRVQLYGTSENVVDAWRQFDRLNAGEGGCP